MAAAARAPTAVQRGQHRHHPSSEGSRSGHPVRWMDPLLIGACMAGHGGGPGEVRAVSAGWAKLVRSLAREVPVALAHRDNGLLMVDVQPRRGQMLDSRFHHNDWEHQVLIARDRGRDPKVAYLGIGIDRPAPDRMRRRRARRVAGAGGSPWATSAITAPAARRRRRPEAGMGGGAAEDGGPEGADDWEMAGRRRRHGRARPAWRRSRGPGAGAARSGRRRRPRARGPEGDDAHVVVSAPVTSAGSAPKRTGPRCVPISPLPRPHGPFVGLSYYCPPPLGDGRPTAWGLPVVGAGQAGQGPSRPQPDHGLLVAGRSPLVRGRVRGPNGGVRGGGEQLGAGWPPY